MEDIEDLLNNQREDRSEHSDLEAHSDSLIGRFGKIACKLYCMMLGVRGTSTKFPFLFIVFFVLRKRRKFCAHCLG